jgi:hypothetical protein
MKRHELTDLRDSIKTAEGWNARTMLLAYAFLRGVPYRACEPVTAPLPPHALDFFRRRLAHDVALSVPAHARADATDKAAVLAWLAEPEAPARQLAREERERAGRARILAARAEFRARVLAARAVTAA